MGGNRLILVSHAGRMRRGRSRVAWQLIAAGHRVELDVWDWAAGRNFVTAMSDALDRADRVVALFSVAYFDRSRYTAKEWSAAAVHVPGMEQGRLVPVRVQEVPLGKVPSLLRALVYRDLFGMGEDETRQRAGSCPRSVQAWPGTAVSGPWPAEVAGRPGAAAAGDVAAHVECPGQEPGVHRAGRAAGDCPGAAAER